MGKGTEYFSPLSFTPTLEKNARNEKKCKKTREITRDDDK